jgi:hypothetical protein
MKDFFFKKLWESAPTSTMGTIHNLLTTGVKKRFAFVIFLACDVAVTVVNAPSDLTWSLGECQSQVSSSNYVQNCCMVHGAVDLICKKSSGNTDTEIKLIINGEEYCTNFDVEITERILIDNEIVMDGNFIFYQGTIRKKLVVMKLSDIFCEHCQKL